MARYRSKDDVDLQWNRIRRRITGELRLQVRDFEEAALDKLLTEAWTRFAKSLESGELIELEPHYEEWVTRALEQSVKVNIAA